MGVVAPRALQLKAGQTRGLNRRLVSTAWTDSARQKQLAVATNLGFWRNLPLVHRTKWLAILKVLERALATSLMTDSPWP